MTSTTKRLYLALGLSALFIASNIVVVTQTSATIYSNLVDWFLSYFLPLF